MKSAIAAGAASIFVRRSTTLLDGIDRYEGDVAKLTPTDHHRVVDECYYCKLCYNHCPYTPPHQYALDFPRLMIAWKKHLAATRGVGWRDRLLIKTDVIGTLGVWWRRLLIGCWAVGSFGG